MDCLSSLWQHLGSAAAPAIRLDGDDYGDAPLDILCLGSGWTYTFLGPAAMDKSLRIASTTRDGRGGTIPFTFDPTSDDTAAFEALPDASLVVVIFPLYETAAVRRLVRGYLDTRRQTEEEGEKPRKQAAFLQLGSTGIWDHGPTLQLAPLSQDEEEEETRGKKRRDGGGGGDSPWKDRHSRIDATIPRGAAEEYLLRLNDSKSARPVSTSVLNLSGLWGHGRSPRRFIGRIAPDKETLSRLGSVHFVHGHDVARAILEMARQWDKAEGQRWLLTNERVYDLWDLASRWGDSGEAGRNHPPSGPQRTWVNQLVAESRTKSTSSSSSSSSVIRAIPRTVEQMGAALDGTDFWITFGITPDVPWVD